MEQTFPTPGPIDLVMEIGPGHATVQTAETDTTTVTITGKYADRFTVQQQGNQIAIRSARRWFIGLDMGSHPVTVEVTAPQHSTAQATLGSCDLTTHGPLRSIGVKSGSGTVSIETADQVDIYSGSGDVQVHHAGDGSAIRTGSGDIRVNEALGQISLASGSGTIDVKTCRGEMNTKSGSGDQEIQHLSAGASLNSASGDIVVQQMTTGSLRARTASGDVQLCAAAGTPVWTDVTSVSGRIASELDSVGAPEEGQPFLEWQIRTVSGDVTMRHL